MSRAARNARVAPGAAGREEAPSGAAEAPGGTAFERAAAGLAEVGRLFHARGWVLGTSGNFSAVVGRAPLRLAITPSGADKGGLDPGRMLEIDALGRVVRGEGRPSAETALHLAIVRERRAGAVLHTHSVWATLLSEVCSAGGGVSLADFEMLKGLDGVATHDHREWLPILDNSQDYATLARSLERLLADASEAHGVLLRRHGLYAWGRDLEEARRHVEVLEFLLEVVGRRWQAGLPPLGASTGLERPGPGRTDGP